ncbi:uncharacterized protein F5147DRAFT_800677 [Suillus discolor]|uniref:Uncharacterized protein n=1 Tax=Suillus discolor TaxID=1912936 RepID=A0A9P7JZA0_9AGAM|nr:uncharacterized protein F5147DRAFT_800677 [Suillus discolor]KAG2118669.1 hypothetical protein F5147DRAFT_800677 [Suillus discolor]
MCVFTDEDAHLAARVEAIPSSTSLPPNIPSVLPPITSSSGSGNWSPQNLPHFPQSLPPVRSQQTSGNSAPIPASAAPANPEPPAPPLEHPALSELRTELHETQASLASHVDKVRTLEDMLAEHEAIKAEVAALRDLIHASSARSQHDNAMNVDSERGRRGQDDDNRSSIRTITPHELERVEDEDESEEQDESKEDREHAQRREELGRLRMPEPSGMGMDEDELMHARASETEPSTSRSRPRSPSPQPSHPALDELSARLVALSGRIDSAVETLRGPRAGLIFFKRDGLSSQDREKRVNDAVSLPVKVAPTNTDYLYSHSPKTYHTFLNHSLPYVNKPLRASLIILSGLSCKGIEPIAAILLARCSH